MIDTERAVAEKYVCLKHDRTKERKATLLCNKATLHLSLLFPSFKVQDSDWISKWDICMKTFWPPYSIKWSFEPIYDINIMQVQNHLLSLWLS